MIKENILLKVFIQSNAQKFWWDIVVCISIDKMI